MVLLFFVIPFAVLCTELTPRFFSQDQCCKNFTTLDKLVFESLHFLPHVHTPLHIPPNFANRFECTLVAIRIDLQIDSNLRVSNFQSSSCARSADFRSRLMHSFGASKSHKHQTSMFYGVWTRLFFGVRWLTFFVTFQC